MVEALVAGHICLDIIPALKSKITFEPGRLIEIGAATLSTGGAVSNTGQALYKLGIDTQLCGKVGEDLFGQAVRDILESTGPGLSTGMSFSPSDPTSYTVVISLSGEDRMFLHAPGCNDTFVATDVTDTALLGAKLIHFGYPTLMARMFADDGREIVNLFERAKRLGVTTSLDMSLPDLAGPASQANWRLILESLLPVTDLFLPNIEELEFMLDRESFDPIREDPLAPDRVANLADEAKALGAKIVGIKAGARGFYLSTSEKLAHLGRATPDHLVAWQGQSVWAPCYQVDVAGTTGAGDATAAGFLMAWLRSFSPVQAALAATAVGACCCEQPDAVSGVQTWPKIVSRVAAGWPTLDPELGTGWHQEEATWKRDTDEAK